MRQDEYIDLSRALSVLRTRWRWVLLVPTIAIAAAVAASFMQTPQYDATATLIAGQQNGIADVTAISAVNQATQSLANMAGDRIVVDRALDDLNLEDEISSTDLVHRVSVKVPTNTQQIELTVRDPDPERAALLANGIAKAFSDMVQDVTKASNLSASVWQPALRPRSAATPNIPLNVALAALLGLVAGIGIAFLRDRLDMNWRSEREVEAALGLPVLAVIPEISARGAREHVYA